MPIAAVTSNWSMVDEGCGQPLYRVEQCSYFGTVDAMSLRGSGNHAQTVL